MTHPSDIPEDIYERADILCDQFRHIEDDRELIARVLMEVGRVAASGLTKKQATVLSFTKAFIDARGFSPNYVEIAEGAGLSNKSRVCAIIDQLEERGFVRRLPHRARSITVVGRA